MLYAEISFTTNKDTAEVLEVLKEMFPTPDLAKSYNSSQLKRDISIEVFTFGARNVSVNILVYFVDRTIMLCIENTMMPMDVSVLKHHVDEYFDKMKALFIRKKIRLQKSYAHINIQGIRIAGERKTRAEGFWEDLKTNGKELFGSFASLGTIWFFTYRGLLSGEKAREKTTDWALGIGPILLMLIVSLLVIVLSKRSYKHFKFTL